MQKEIINLIKTALAEDKVNNDLTTIACGLGNKNCIAEIIAKQEGVLAGIEICAEVFNQINPEINFKPLKKDGEKFKKGEIVAEIKGSAASILSGERCALNFLSFLSGIAAKTNKIVEIIQRKNERLVPAKAGIKILDTRKTIPGLRAVSKYAVAIGGGVNHRMNLADGILIKDNHLKFMSITDAVKRARLKFGKKYKIEAETETLAQVREAALAGADIIMLDNMTIDMIKMAIRIIDKKAKIEVSGGVTEEKLKELRKLDIDYISMGSLTNNIKPVDFSLEIMNRGLGTGG